MIEILKNYSIQLLFTIGLIIIFGLIVWIFNKIFYKLMGRKGRIACIVTGFIGTPIHEIGHAFFCFVFNHQIEEVRLFSPNSKDGALGYVQHSFEKKSIYQQVGNFFIGIGPVIFGSCTLWILMSLFLPNVLKDLQFNFDMLSINNITQTGTIIFNGFKILFTFENITNYLWWIFMILACSIALHMSISIPDIKSSVKGLSYIVVVLFILNLALYIINSKYMFWLTKVCISVSSFILNFLMISVLLSIILFLISLIFKICGLGK